MQEEIIEMLKKKIQFARDCEYAVMNYLDESFKIPQDVSERLEEAEKHSGLPTSSMIYLWKENFFKTKGLTPFSVSIDDYKEEAIDYMKATSPYCFDIDTSDMMITDQLTMLSSELAFYALSVGASDEQVKNIMNVLKEVKCIIPDDSVRDRRNVADMQESRISLDDILGTTIDYYQSNNLLGTLTKLSDKNIAGFISYMMKGDVMRYPERVFHGVSVDDDGNNLFVSEGNHRVFTYKALQVIRDSIVGESKTSPTIQATVFRHRNHSKNAEFEI